jgi:peptide-methionine (S)-S-oxide reductase
MAKGVVKVESGYSGGSDSAPTYEAVCGGRTGHAEVVRIEFDPAVISYGELLDIFFGTHDPTTLNRQGADVGTQYRSTIFTQDKEQAAAARTKIGELEAAGIFDRPIVTTIEPAAKFHPAEDYHRNYYRDNPMQPYCQAVVGPKVAKFRKSFADKLIGS